MSTMTTNPLTLPADLIGAVFTGNSIPAHDETFDLAEKIGLDLKAFHAYVASVRSPKQADEALVELAEAILKTAKTATQTGA